MNEKEIKAEYCIEFDKHEREKEEKWEREERKPPSKQATWKVY